MLARTLAPRSAAAKRLPRLRRYATLTNDDRWPAPAHPRRPPTPYEILETAPGAPYTRTRFTELVKLYHPDLAHGGAPARISPAERLERYRLAVQAHEILSDPVRRRAYDSCGAGWAGGPGGAAEAWAAGTAEDGRPMRFYGRDDVDGPWTNATWEDWQAWHARQQQKEGAAAPGANGKKKPVFASHGSFGTVLVALAIVGGTAQMVHAEKMSSVRRLTREERHYKATRDLEERRNATRMDNDKEARIESFVKLRDPAVFDNAGLVEAVVRPDICESGDSLAQRRKREEAGKKPK
jgi:curved DNA-binding protein CbpA